MKSTHNNVWQKHELTGGQLCHCLPHEMTRPKTDKWFSCRRSRPTARCSHQVSSSLYMYCMMLTIIYKIVILVCNSDGQMLHITVQETAFKKADNRWNDLNGHAKVTKNIHTFIHHEGRTRVSEKMWQEQWERKARVHTNTNKLFHRS